MNGKLKQTILKAYKEYPIDISPIIQNGARVGTEYFISPHESRGMRLRATYTTADTNGKPLPPTVRTVLNLSFKFWDQVFKNVSYSEKASIPDYKMHSPIGRSPSQNDLMDIYAAVSKKVQDLASAATNEKIENLIHLIETEFLDPLLLDKIRSEQR